MFVAQAGDFRLRELESRSAQRNVCRDLEVHGSVRAQAVLDGLIERDRAGVGLRDSNKTAREVSECRCVGSELLQADFQGDNLAERHTPILAKSHGELVMARESVR